MVVLEDLATDHECLNVRLRRSLFHLWFAGPAIKSRLLIAGFKARRAAA